MHNNRRSRSRNSNNDQFDMLRDIIYDYNEVMYYYNSNMRRMIDIIQPVSDTQNNRNRNYLNQQFNRREQVDGINDNMSFINNNTNRNNNNNNNNRNNNRNNNTNLHPNRYINVTDNANGLFTHNFQVIRDRFQDVIVRPTNFQIRNAVEDFCYDPSGQYTNTYTVLSYIENPICPITMEPIIPGTIVSRIRYCQHIFSYASLRNWFTMNTRCPCCRYDIRETPIPLIFNGTDTSMNIPNQSTQTQTQTQTQPQTQTQTTNDQSPTETEQINILDRELNNLFNNEQPNQSSTRVSDSWRNISNLMRTFIQEEIRNNPVASELLYTFDIPLFDFSGNFYN